MQSALYTVCLSTDVVAMTYGLMYWERHVRKAMGQHRGEGLALRPSHPTRGREGLVSDERCEGQPSGSTQLCQTYRKMYNSD